MGLTYFEIILYYYFKNAENEGRIKIGLFWEDATVFGRGVFSALIAYLE
jgi:hypothetical protein